MLGKFNRTVWLIYRRHFTLLLYVQLRCLLGCCCQRRSFIRQHVTMLRAWQQMALREDESAIQVNTQIIHVTTGDRLAPLDVATGDKLPKLSTV